jgi:hypothetical protein
MKHHRFSLSGEQWRQVNSAAALLRASDRPRFVADIVRYLELYGGLNTVTNERVADAISAILGVTAVKDEDCL